MNIDNQIRVGYDLIIDEVPFNSRVLDLGCGDGLLLELLQQKKNIKGAGVEISEVGVGMCVEKGLYCFQGDIDEGLSDYRDNSFDYVILNQTLQSTRMPDYVLHETLRIARNAIVSFPNFGHIYTRLQLAFTGRMPKNKLLPYEWYESPDIHHATIKDFKNFCQQAGYQIQTEKHFSPDKNSNSKRVLLMPNLFAQFAFFILDGQPVTGKTEKKNK